jgi:hypothetical protein
MNMQTTTLKKVQEQAFELFVKKNQDYGNSFAKFGIVGILVRLQDKIDRCLILLDNEPQIKEEKICDTMLDISNYACMGICLLQNEQNNMQEAMQSVHKEALVKVLGEAKENAIETFLKLNDELSSLIDIREEKSVNIKVEDNKLKSFLYTLHIHASLHYEDFAC